MNIPVLTIGIPTWNRAAYLKRAVQSAARQIEAEQLPVEIVISDNASDDDTQAVTKDLFHNHRCVRPIHRQAKNVGGDNNLRTLAGLARGEYLWFLGDDDRILPGALRWALEAIQEQPAAFYHCMVSYRAGKTPRLIVNDGMATLNHYGWINLQGFISACMARTSTWQAGMESGNWPLYIQNSFPHACVLLERQLIDGGPAVIIDRPMVEPQDAQQTRETLQRWTEGRTIERYPRAADALCRLAVAGLLPPVEVDFFLYGETHLWTKITGDLSAFQLQLGRVDLAADEDTWQRLDCMADLLRDEAAATMLRRQFCALRQALEAERAIMRAHEAAFDGITRAFDQLRRPAALPGTRAAAAAAPNQLQAAA